MIRDITKMSNLMLLCKLLLFVFDVRHLLYMYRVAQKFATP